jgi:hypothetical protein
VTVSEYTSLILSIENSPFPSFLSHGYYHSLKINESCFLLVLFLDWFEGEEIKVVVGDRISYNENCMKVVHLTFGSSFNVKYRDFRNFSSQLLVLA